MTTINIRNYGPEYYSHNSKEVRVGCLKLWFSYDTVITFSHGMYEMGRIFIRKNDWGSTTGRHLNMILTDKSIRIDRDKFQEHLKKALKLGVIYGEQ